MDTILLDEYLNIHLRNVASSLDMVKSNKLKVLYETQPKTEKLRSTLDASIKRLKTITTTTQELAKALETQEKFFVGWMDEVNDAIIAPPDSKNENVERIKLAFIEKDWKMFIAVKATKEEDELALKHIYHLRTLPKYTSIRADRWLILLTLELRTDSPCSFGKNNCIGVEYSPMCSDAERGARDFRNWVPILKKFVDNEPLFEELFKIIRRKEESDLILPFIFECSVENALKRIEDYFGNWESNTTSSYVPVMLVRYSMVIRGMTTLLLNHGLERIVLERKPGYPESGPHKWKKELFKPDSLDTWPKGCDHYKSTEWKGSASMATEYEVEHWHTRNSPDCYETTIVMKENIPIWKSIMEKSEWTNKEFLMLIVMSQVDGHCAYAFSKNYRDYNFTTSFADIPKERLKKAVYDLNAACGGNCAWLPDVVKAFEKKAGL